MDPILLDAAGHRRSPVTMPGYHRGRPPRNKGLRYPADPPTIDEIIAVLRAAGDGRGADRLRALVVLLWRAGLRISEALDLAETDLDRFTGGILIRRGKGGKRRVVGMDRWGCSSPGLRSAPGSQQAICCASSTARPPAGTGKPPPRANSSPGPPRPRESDAASRRISSVTRMRSRWHTKESHSS